LAFYTSSGIIETGVLQSCQTKPYFTSSIRNNLCVAC